MSLEKRIKEFAEQARGYLLEEFARSRKKDTEIVQWQGYNEDGKLLAKNKDLVPTVDGLGQKYATKGSDLILDSAGSVEQRKLEEDNKKLHRKEKHSQHLLFLLYQEVQIYYYSSLMQLQNLLKYTKLEIIY